MERAHHCAVTRTTLRKGSGTRQVLVTRRKTFDPAQVPDTFWRRDEVQVALARRDAGALFRIYLDAFSECTQTQLALLTAHDRSDVSNFVRGTRTGVVSDIDVLGRIADGLLMPDPARVLFGLAPAAARMSQVGGTPAAPALPGTAVTDAVVTGWFLNPGSDPVEQGVAICGSRACGTDGQVIDDTVRALGVLLTRHRWRVSHGPIGVGIEVMTYVADQYRPAALVVTAGIFGRPNVVRNAAYVLVIGGATGTQAEVDIALAMGKRVLPLPASGGTAARTYQRLRRQRPLRAWIRDEDFTALEDCGDGDNYSRIVERVLAFTPGSGA